MSEVKLITDSASDLSVDFYLDNDIAVVPFYVTFDKIVYYKEHEQITTSEFFQRLRTENVFPSTSLPTAMDYKDVFHPFLKNGNDIVCLCITSKFSGSYQNAVLAADELKEEFPERGIFVIDSLQASGGQGVTLYQMIKMKRAGFTAQQIADRIEEIKDTSRVFLTVDTLEYLRKGGRLGKLSAFAGTILQIKPIIVQQYGELNPISKVRGRKKALERVLKMLVDYVGDRKYDYDYILLHADCYNEAAPIEQKMHDMGFQIDLPIQEIGVTIGSHTGPTLIGIAPILKYDAVL